MHDYFHRCQKTRKPSPIKAQIDQLGEVVRRYPFPPLTEKEAIAWVQSEANRFDRVLSPQAARSLTERVGPNSALLAQEVRKVATSSPQPEISREWIETLVRPRSESQMFGFIEAFSSESPKRCLELLQKERAAGTDDGLLFSLLVRQIRLLLQARSLHEHGVSQDVWRKTLAIPPFVLTKLHREIQHYSLSQLMQWHDVAQQIDLAMKRGRYRPAYAVDVLVGHLLQQKTTDR